MGVIKTILGFLAMAAAPVAAVACGLGLYSPTLGYIALMAWGTAISAVALVGAVIASITTVYRWWTQPCTDRTYKVVYRIGLAIFWVWAVFNIGWVSNLILDGPFAPMALFGGVAASMVAFLIVLLWMFKHQKD